MARVVYKYEIGYGLSATEMPIGAKLLCAAADPAAEKIFVWAEVDPGAPKTQREIGYFSTGDYLIPLDAEYVDSAATPDLNYVWHVYERVQF